jgi:predicted double-glycine peptidase
MKIGRAANFGWIVALTTAALSLGCTPLCTERTHAQNSLRPAGKGLYVAARKPTHCRRMTAWRHTRPIRQSASFTCGPAALATLIHTYLGQPATEKEIARIAHTFDARTTSLADLEDACRVKGLRSRASTMSLPELIRTTESRDLPVLVHLYEPEQHFALFVGRAKRGLMIFDPAYGNRYLAQERFLRRWSGATLVVGRMGDPIIDPNRPATN